MQTFNLFESSNECVECSSLGNSTHIPLGRMFFTISPDPELSNFNDKSPDSQKRFVDSRFSIALKELDTKCLSVRGYAYHYEINRAMNLHIHGIIMIDQDKEFYDIWLARASKIFNRHFGRQGLRSNISSKFEWMRDLQAVCEYVNKSNVYPPVHREQQALTTIEMFLMKGKERSDRAGPKEDTLYDTA